MASVDARARGCASRARWRSSSRAVGREHALGGGARPGHPRRAPDADAPRRVPWGRSSSSGPRRLTRTASRTVHAPSRTLAARDRHDGLHGPVLTGLLLTRRRRWSGLQLRARRSVLTATLSASYDKRHLLWFGETVPLADRRALAAPSLRTRARPDAPGAARWRSPQGPCARRSSSATRTRCRRPGGRQRKLRRTCSSTSRTTRGSSAAQRASFTCASRPSGPSSFGATWCVRSTSDRRRGSMQPAGFERAAAADFPSVLAADPALLETAPSLYACFGDAPLASLLIVLAGALTWRATRRP